MTCQNPLQDSYFQLNGSTLCPSCAEKARYDRQLQENQAGGLPRAILFGLGAGVAGSIIYGGIVMLTGFEFALVAILIGWMVGKAMIRGSRGVGGRRFQISAVLITYLSITGGYVPSIVQEVMKSAPKQEAANGQTVTAAADTTAAQRPASPELRGVLIAFALLMGVAAIAPFLSLTTGISGIIGLFIIFVGLSRAWKETQPQPFAISGPFAFEAPAAQSDGATV